MYATLQWPFNILPELYIYLICPYSLFIFIVMFLYDLRWLVIMIVPAARAFPVTAISACASLLDKKENIVAEMPNVYEGSAACLANAFEAFQKDWKVT